MTNEALQQTNNEEKNKVFYLSRRRVVFYTLGVFLLSLLVAFWADNLMVGGVWLMTGAEILAIFCFAAGVAFLFFVIFKFTEVKPLVSVSEEGLTIKRKKGIRFIRFSDVVSIRGHEGLLNKLFGAQKIVIETHFASYGIYISAKETDSFFACLPVFRKNDAALQELTFHKERYLALLSYFVRLTLLFVIVFAATFPAVAVLLDGFSESRFYLFALLFIYGAALLVGFIRYACIFIRYAGTVVRVGADRFSISYGKKMSSTEHELFFDSILAFRLKESLIERLFGVCKLTVESRQKSKGVSDYNYFPFLMPRAKAEALVCSVIPEHDFSAQKTRVGARGILPYCEYALWFVAAVILMSVFLTPFMLFLLLIPAALILLMYAHEGYVLEKESAAFVFGAFAAKTLVVRYKDIESISASDNLSSARLALTAVDITVGQYTRVFSVGYMKRADFSELTEKLEKKVDKEK